MGLVNELQESAERDDVLTVLRKAKRLSSKLGRPDINEWLEHEQSGYPRGDLVPSYREVGGTFCYNTNGYIPAGYGMVQTGIAPLHGFDSLGLTIPQVDPISGILASIAELGKGNGLFVSVPEKAASTMRNSLRATHPDILRQLTFLFRLNESQICDIPEQVKNKVLDWACKLEAAGVTGDGVSFTSKEREIAQTVVFNITNSKVGQISNDGTNLKM